MDNKTEVEITREKIREGMLEALTLALRREIDKHWFRFGFDTHGEEGRRWHSYCNCGQWSMSSEYFTPEELAEGNTGYDEDQPSVLRDAYQVHISEAVANFVLTYEFVR